MRLTSIFIQLAFATGIFVIVFLAFKKLRPVPHPLKQFRFWITWIVTTSTLYLIILKVFVSVSFRTPSEEFTKERWHNNQNVRTQIVDDLLDKKLLEGKSKTEVIDLLGNPIEDSQYFRETGSDMIYYLGPERSFMGVDSEWLLIWLSDNKVSKCKVMTD